MTSANYDSTDGRLRGRRGMERRMRIWTRNPYCGICGKLTTPGQDSIRPFHADHVVSLEDGGPDTDANLWILCQSPCHQDKTAKDRGYKPRLQFDSEGRVKW